MSQEDRKTSDNAGADAVKELTESLTHLVGSVFGVGAAVAKSVAEATAGDRPLPSTKGEGPLGEMITYGVAAASNVVRTVVAGAGSAAKAAQEATQKASGSETPPTHPQVHAGGTLRIPLSIENPSDQPLAAMTFVTKEIRHRLDGAGDPLSAAAVRFSPQTLTIGPKDFEKLTVYVDTTATAAPGIYVVRIGVVSGDFETEVGFAVLPAQQV
jgi:hypothetical protein